MTTKNTQSKRQKKKIIFKKYTNSKTFIWYQEQGNVSQYYFMH